MDMKEICNKKYVYQMVIIEAKEEQFFEVLGRDC
jgi:hypothetical protein